MSKKPTIQQLLSLLDDESSIVRYAVAKELVAYGPELISDLKKMKATDAELLQVKARYEEYQIEWLQTEWKSWLNEPDDFAKLESAMSLLADFQNGPHPKIKLKFLLDQLAHEFTASGQPKNARELAEFLFQRKNLRGAKVNYYDPRHSNLIYVIEKKKGIPISLCLVYMLVGHRLGLTVEGCNFPGHFLVRVEYQGLPCWVDCYAQGRFYTEKEILKIQEENPEPMEEILRLSVNAETMVMRCLVNLLESYRRLELAEHCDVMTRLITQLKNKLETTA